MSEFFPEQMKILYHGTLNIHLESLHSGIDLLQCNKYTDFSRGFYLTSNEKQARSRAFGKYYEYMEDRTIEDEKKLDIQPVCVQYLINTKRFQDIDSSKVFRFDNYGELWAEFIYNNRMYNSTKLRNEFHNRDSRFDCVYGPVADGGNRIGLQIKDLLYGVITFKEFTNNIKPKYPFPQDHQISFHTEEALECLEIGGSIFYDTVKVSV